MHRTLTIGRRMLWVAVLCALGAGASQALAGPSRAAPPVCVEEECNAYCQANGYMGGYCEMGRYCMCSVPVAP